MAKVVFEIADEGNGLVYIFHSQEAFEFALESVEDGDVSLLAALPDIETRPIDKDDEI